MEQWHYRIFPNLSVKYPVVDPCSALTSMTKYGLHVGRMNGQRTLIVELSSEQQDLLTAFFLGLGQFIIHPAT